MLNLRVESWIGFKIRTLNLLNFPFYLLPELGLTGPLADDGNRKWWSLRWLAVAAELRWDTTTTIEVSGGDHGGADPCWWRPDCDGDMVLMGSGGGDDGTRSVKGEDRRWSEVDLVLLEDEGDDDDGGRWWWWRKMMGIGWWDLMEVDGNGERWSRVAEMMQVAAVWEIAATAKRGVVGVKMDEDADG